MSSTSPDPQNLKADPRLPHSVYFNEALAAGGQPDPSKVYFVDDSALNIKGAHALNWGHCVLFDEHGDQRPKLGGLEKLPTGGNATVSVITSMEGEFGVSLSD